MNTLNDERYRQFSKYDGGKHDDPPPQDPPKEEEEKDGGEVLNRNS